MYNVFCIETSIECVLCRNLCIMPYIFTVIFLPGHGYLALLDFFFCLQEGALLCWRQLYTFCLLRACGSPDYPPPPKKKKSVSCSVFTIHSHCGEYIFLFGNVCRRRWRLSCVFCELLLVLCEVLPCVLCCWLLWYVCMYVYTHIRIYRRRWRLPCVFCEFLLAALVSPTARR
jgi:hypothetical protein